VQHQNRKQQDSTSIEEIKVNSNPISYLPRREFYKGVNNSREKLINSIAKQR
jgi:hypothetical protein